MKLLSKTLLLLALSTTAFAQPVPVPPAPPAPPALAAPAAPSAPAAAGPAKQSGKTISLKFEGQLGQAMRKIAEAGGINLVVTGKLDERADVYLTDVSAEEALGIVAKLHNLKVLRQGKIWTVRPMTGDELEQAQDQAQEADEAAQEAAQEQEEAAQQAREEAEQAAQEAEEARQEAREQAEQAAALAGANGEEVAQLQQRLQAKIDDKVRAKLERKLSRLSNEQDVAGFGRTIVVAEGETVKKVVAYGGALEIYGHVEKDAVSFGGPIKLGPKAVVEGDVVSFGAPIEKADGAVVEGDEIAYSSAAPGVRIANGFRRVSHPHVDRDDSDNRGFSMQLPSFFLWFAVLFGIGFFAMMIAPNPMKKLEAQLHGNLARVGATGAVSLVALPVLSVLLSITIVGVIPVVLFWVLVFPVGLAAGVASIAKEIGARIPLRNVRKTQALVLAMGLFVMLVAFYIPYIGPLAMGVVGLLSLGAFIRTLMAARRNRGMPEPVSTAGL